MVLLSANAVLPLTIESLYALYYIFQTDRRQTIAMQINDS